MGNIAKNNNYYIFVPDTHGEVCLEKDDNKFSDKLL